MLVEFIGQSEEEARRGIVAFGFTFKYGQPTEIPDGHKVLEKLKSNRHFKCAGEKTKYEESKPEKPSERLELEEKAKKLGITHVGVKSDETLTKEIEEIELDGDED